MMDTSCSGCAGTGSSDRGGELVISCPYCFGVGLMMNPEQRRLAVAFGARSAIEEAGRAVDHILGEVMPVDGSEPGAGVLIIDRRVLPELRRIYNKYVYDAATADGAPSESGG